MSLPYSENKEQIKQNLHAYSPFAIDVNKQPIIYADPHLPSIGYPYVYAPYPIYPMHASNPVSMHPYGAPYVSPHPNNQQQLNNNTQQSINPNITNDVENQTNEINTQQQ